MTSPGRDPDAGAGTGAVAARGGAEFGEVDRLKGVVFRSVSAAASWAGILVLAVLLAYVAYDALALGTASAGWYLLYGTVVGIPTLAVPAYCYRHRAAVRTVAGSSVVLLGGTTAGVGTLLVFVVLDPATWFTYVLTFVLPTAAVATLGFTDPGGRRGWARAALVPVGGAGLLMGATATGGMPASDAVRTCVELLAPGVVLAGFLYVGARRESIGRVGAYALFAAPTGALVGYGLLGAAGVLDLALPADRLVYGAGVGAALLGVLAYVIAGDEPVESAVGVATPLLVGAAVVAGRRIAPAVADAGAAPLGRVAAGVAGVSPGVWTVYFTTLVVPGSVLAGAVAARGGVVREGKRGIALVAGTVVAAAVAASALARFGTGAVSWLWPWLFGLLDADVALVFVLTLVTPAGLYAAWVLRSPERSRPERVGLAAPFLVLGGAALAGGLANALGIAGPEAWLDWQFVTSLPSRFPEQAGMYVSIVGSVFIVLLVALFSFPLGVGAAIYLEEYAPERGLGGRLARVVQVNVSNLAGVPSVVYGLLGLGLFVNLVGLGFGTVLVAALTLSLLILPIVVISAQEAIRAVPDAQRRASYGMGATRWQTVRNVVLPRALPGILTGTILALGRAIGETAPLIMVGLPNSVFDAPTGPTSVTSAMPLQVFNWAFRPDPAFRTGVTAAGVVVLLAVLSTMNSVAILVRNRYRQN